MKPRKLPSGSWFIQVQSNGVRRSFTAKTKSEVLYAAQKYKLTSKDAPSATLGDLIDNYIAVKGNVLSPSTTARYKQIRRLDFQRLMNTPARELTAGRIQKEINLMAADHSAKSVRNAYGLITAALAMYAPELHFRVSLPQQQRLEYSVPTTEQVYKLIDAASPNLKTAIMLAAFCGLRRGEIAALTSKDIDGNLIRVRRAAVYDSERNIVEKNPKTYSSARTVAAPAFVIDYIKGIDGRICPLALNSITRRFVELRDRLDLNCRFHDLRHYYASALHAVGVKDQYIMKFGGWKSDNVLKAVYRDTLDDFEQAAASRAATYFEESANKMLIKQEKSQ